LDHNADLICSLITLYESLTSWFLFFCEVLNVCKSLKEHILPSDDTVEGIIHKKDHIISIARSNRATIPDFSTTISLCLCYVLYVLNLII